MTGVPRISDSLDYGLAGEPRLLGQVSNNLCLCPVADLIDDARENVRKREWRTAILDPNSERCLSAHFAEIVAMIAIPRHLQALLLK